MTPTPHIDTRQVSEVGGRTLKVLAETDRLNAWMFSKLAPHVRGDVLEIGSGLGNISRLIAPRATKAIFTDIEPHYLDSLRQAFADDPRISVAAYNLDKEPPPEVASRRFDTIVAVNIIEHIRDDRRAVARLAQLLRPGGSLVVYVPACPFAYGSLDRALGHYRRYTPGTLASLLKDAGLQPERPAYMNLLGLLGWTVTSRLLRAERLSQRQMALFERLVWLFRAEDHVRLPVGLGLYTAARRPAS